MALGGIGSGGAMNHYELLLFTACLTLFTSWLSYLTYRLRMAMDNIEGSQSGFDEINEALELSQKALAAIWEQMPTIDRIQELVPQFHINQQETNGKHLFDLLGNLLGIGEQSLQTPGTERGPDGRFNGPTQIQESSSETTQSKTDVEGSTSD
jgi:hypothetical protein